MSRSPRRVGGGVKRSVNSKEVVVLSDNTAITLKSELAKLGAREFEVVALTMDPERGWAALQYAIEREAERPIQYAIAMFDNPNWRPSGETTRRGTNQPAPDVACQTCGGDRFVLVSLRKPMQSAWMKERGIEPSETEMIEEMAACPDCNQADTSFWRADGSRSRALDPEKIREMMRR